MLAPALVVLVVMSLAGCAGSGSAPPGVTAAVVAAVTAAWNLRKMGDDPLLKGSGGDYFKDYLTLLGAHVQFFLRWRAEAHLQTESDTNTVAVELAAEYDLVRAFASNVVGLDVNAPSALVSSSDTSPHLDIVDVLQVRADDPGPKATDVRNEQIERWKRAMSIVWRAAALEPELWTPNFSQAALKELLDRRLRIIERMVYQISSDVAARGSLEPTAANPHGPWDDGVRVRSFEYPILAGALAVKIGAPNIGPGKIWEFDFAGELLNYEEGNGRRIRAAADAAFTSRATESYLYDVVPGGDPSANLDKLFTPSTNWWDRSWIFCDHVLAALHLESLRFGKRRREGNDATFNGALNGHAQGWAALRPLFPPSPGDPDLMADDHAKPPAEPRLFAAGPVRQVQIGDHVVFWNSIMYGLLYDGAWSLENAVVVGVASEWKSNDIGDSIRLMGHGTPEQSGGGYREDMAKNLNSALKRARHQARNAPAGVNTVPWLRSAAPLVRWAPFGEHWIDEHGNPQDPWWMRVPFESVGDWQGRAIGRAATLATLPDAIEYDPAAGFAGPLPATGGGPAGAAYFPLWWPDPGRWKDYIQRRKNGKVPSTFQLKPLKFDRPNIPGLVYPTDFLPGVSGLRVYAVRPFVARS